MPYGFSAAQKNREFFFNFLQDVLLTVNRVPQRQATNLVAPSLTEDEASRRKERRDSLNSKHINLCLDRRPSQEQASTPISQGDLGEGPEEDK